MEAHDYHINLNWLSDRKGLLSSPELDEAAPGIDTSLEVATPPDFPKGMPGIWSPEHLLTAAVSSCLMTTFLAIAENSKLDFVSFTCAAKGTVDTVEGKLILSEVELSPVVTIKLEHDRDRALRIIQKSEAACLISNSIKSKITMTPSIQVQG